MIPKISYTTTALPEYHYSREKVLRVGADWLGAQSQSYALFSRFVNSSRIEERYFALPLEVILRLGGVANRAKQFYETGSALASEVVSQMFRETSLKPSEIGTVIFTSCSVPLIPTLDIQILNNFNFPSGTRRVPLYQYGCAGGAAGLSLAAALCKSNKATLLISVELCSLVFQREDLGRGNLVGSAIFADGAACVVVSPNEGALRYIDTTSHLLPDSEHLMGYDLLDDGTHLMLNKELPERLAAALPSVIDGFLARNEMLSKDIDHWLIHPGGVKILHAIEKIFNLNTHQARWAWEVLERYGNMSSASLLFVLHRFVKEHSFESGRKVLMVGVGPGLTIELLLFET